MAQATTNFAFAIQGVSATLLVAKFDLVEAMSGLFELELTFASEEKDLAFADAIGKDALLSVEVEGAEPRFVHGLVSRLRLGDPGKKLSFYQVTVVPKLWRLTHRRDSRIFQEKSVPDIVKEVLTQAGVSDVRWSITGSYSPREYCVQYGESDLDFVQRLMEDEGIRPDEINFIEMAREELLAEKPEVVRDLVRGIAESGEWAERNRSRPGSASPRPGEICRDRSSLLASTNASRHQDPRRRRRDRGVLGRRCPQPPRHHAAAPVHRR